MLAVFIVNTACSSNVSNNQSEMNKKMDIAENAKVVHLTKADFWLKFITTRRIPVNGNMKAINLPSLISMPLGVDPVK